MLVLHVHSADAPSGCGGWWRRHGFPPRCGHALKAEVLLATYLHPPMVPPEDSQKVTMGSLQPHPPMIPQEWSGAYEYHDAGMPGY